MRYVVAVLGVLALIAALAAVKGKQISNLMAAGKEFQKSGPPPESVSTAIAKSEAWEGTISAVGSLTAGKGVAISNDAPGVVSRIFFESGAVVKQGQVLVELDSRVERAQLASARAHRELAQTSEKRTRALVASNSIPASQLDTDESTLKSSTADVAALEAQIERKVVRAPFGGKLGIREVNLGQYLNPGTTLTVLESTESVYADFTLPQQELQRIHVSTPVRMTLTTGDAGAPIDGLVAAIDPTIDQLTRTIKIRASAPNKDDRLRPGMFVNVEVILPTQGSVVSVPATALIHASFGDSVFIVEDAPNGAEGKVARQQFVRVGGARGDFVAIDDGVKAGQEVVVAGAFKLRNGAKVVVKNDGTVTAPELSPHPENR